MQISCVIITFNEEKNIFRCLNSLKDIVDEIIVIDSFSTDNTENIVKSFPNIRFVQNKWSDYSTQKNFGNNLAKYDYILSIDADEELSKELQESLLKIKETNKDEQNIFAFNRRNNYCGYWIKHCGWYPDKKIRLFNRKYTHWYGDIHEYLVFNTPQTNILHLKGDLLHYSYYSISEHIAQIDKFTTLTAKNHRDKSKQISFIKMYFAVKWKFIRDYIFKLGFLDGKYGYQICKLSSIATMIKYIKINENIRHKNNCNK